ncbi:MAG: hypothetical protein M3R00_03960, partial [Pseudomonadota bacterium]|nr:hypothetical protein [Pseudomonadota bacterium]
MQTKPTVADQITADLEEIKRLNQRVTENAKIEWARLKAAIQEDNWTSEKLELEFGNSFSIFAERFGPEFSNLWEIIAKYAKETAVHTIFWAERHSKIPFDHCMSIAKECENLIALSVFQSLWFKSFKSHNLFESAHDYYLRMCDDFPNNKENLAASLSSLQGDRFDRIYTVLLQHGCALRDVNLIEFLLQISDSNGYDFIKSGGEPFTVFEQHDRGFYKLRSENYNETALIPLIHKPPLLIAAERGSLPVLTSFFTYRPQQATYFEITYYQRGCDDYTPA